MSQEERDRVTRLGIDLRERHTSFQCPLCGKRHQFVSLAAKRHLTYLERMQAR